MKSVVLAAEAVVGSHCGTDHQGSLATLGLLADEIRRQGYCASGPWADALVVLAPDGRWEEYHAVAFATGCYSQDPAQLPKYRWHYNGTNPSPVACTSGAGVVDQIVCKLHQGYGLWDCTPKINGGPVRPEGDPERAACEAAAMGGRPVYAVTGAGLSIELVANPMQFILRGSGSGSLSCTVPKTGATDLCRSTSVSR
jgi:hypothetical protein